MVEGFLDSQHLQQVDLAGWSMGGWIGMRVALDQPERVRRLVLLDSAGLRFKLGFDPALFQPSSLTDLAELEDLLIPHPHRLPRFVAMAMLRRGDQIGWVVRRSVQSMMTGQDLLDGKLASLTMPVLIGWGDKDKLIPISVGYALHAQILQSVLDVYEGCGTSGSWAMYRSGGPERRGFSQCAAGKDGDGAAYPGNGRRRAVV